MTYAIQTVLGTGTKLKVLAVGYYMGANTSTIRWEIASSSDALVASGTFPLTQEEFASWGTNDMYIVNLTCTRLGLTLI